MQINTINYNGEDLEGLNIDLTIQGDIETEELNVTENGEYAAAPGKAFDKVSVDVVQKGEVIDKSVQPNQIKMLVNITEDVANCYVLYIQTVAHGVEVDWGDGTSTSSSASIEKTRSQCATINHIYTDYGLKIITLTANEGQVGLIGSNGFLSFAGAPGSVNGNQYPNNVYRYSVLGLYFGDLPYMYYENDKSVDLSAGGLYEIINAINPNTGNNSALTNLIINKQSTYIGMNVTLPGLQSINIPPCPKLSNNLFRNCTALKKVDMTDWTVEDLLNSTWGASAFYSAHSSLQIIFKTKEIMEVAKTITNLSEYGDYMTYEGEITS